MNPGPCGVRPAIRPLPCDASTLRGLSERLIQSHHRNNYSGALKRLHAIRAQLGTLDWAAASAEQAQRASNVKRIDVRRKGAYDASTDMIEGAIWRDPASVDEWTRELSGTDVVVYRVYGHEVGQSTAARLRDAGIAARHLVGGIRAWRDAGRPVQPK